MHAMANKISVCVSLFSCGFRSLVIFIQACFYRRSNLCCWCNLRQCTVVTLPGCKGSCRGRCGCCSIPGCIHWHLTLFSSVSLVMVAGKFVAIFSDVFRYVPIFSDVVIDQSHENDDLMFFYWWTIIIALSAAIGQCFLWNLFASCTFMKPPI